MKNKKIMLVLSILSISIFAVGCTNAQNGSDSSKKETKSNYTPSFLSSTLLNYIT